MADPEKLILLIQKEESVWNIYSEDFVHKILKMEAWNRIAENLTPEWKELSREEKDKIIESLKKKWNHIKDYYKREKMANKIYYSKRKSEYVQRRKYIFNNILGFLDPTLDITISLARQKARVRNLRKCVTNKSSKTAAKVEIMESSEESQNILDNLMTNTTYEKQDTLNQSTMSTPPQWKETSTEYLMTQMPLPNSPQHLNTLTPQTKKDIYAENFTAQTAYQGPGFLGLNPNLAFLLSFSQEMDEMTSYQRMEFKSEVMNLLKMIKYPVKMETI